MVNLRLLKMLLSGIKKSCSCMVTSMLKTLRSMLLLIPSEVALVVAAIMAVVVVVVFLLPDPLLILLQPSPMPLPCLPRSLHAERMANFACVVERVVIVPSNAWLPCPILMGHLPIQQTSRGSSSSRER
jgi:hypothetical protein